MFVSRLSGFVWSSVAALKPGGADTQRSESRHQNIHLFITSVLHPSIHRHSPTGAAPASSRLFTPQTCRLLRCSAAAAPVGSPPSRRRLSHPPRRPGPLARCPVAAPRLVRHGDNGRRGGDGEEKTIKSAIG